MRNDFALDFRNVTKRYGEVAALDDVSVRAAHGEFLTILGQSGSGKTTLLRIAAGLEQPTSASAVLIDGRDMTDVPAYRRQVNTVFQHYGLFPHMTVRENVEYGLKLRGVSSAERAAKASAMLERVRLPGKAGRRINQLSGGERQRVALARSLVLDPKILLLDEPLGALDERLRLDMQIELVELQRNLGTTFVFITHSQEEALTMSDRIILMSGGRIAQEGSPRDLFERPSSGFCAAFMGVENLVRGEVAHVDGHAVTIRHGESSLEGVWSGIGLPARGSEAVLALRAERLTVERGHVETQGKFSVRGEVNSRVYKGKYVDLVVKTPLGPLVARTWDHAPEAGPVTLRWDAAHATVTPA